MVSKNRKHISISITERCNLNCIYCFEKSKSKERMSFDTAVKIIENELLHLDGYDAVYFDFMGGEPFLEFDLIRNVCEYFWNKKWEKEYVFYTTTNGTLVHGDIMEWLYANRDRFICCLSLDGGPEAQNINRSNSFSSVDISFFRKSWPDQKVKTIVSDQTLPMLYDSIRYLHNLGFSVVEAKLAYGFDWSKKEYEDILISELAKLKDFYLQNPQITGHSLLNLNIIEAADPDQKIRKWCGAGERTVSYDMKGDKYPCRYFQDIRKNKHVGLEDIWATDFSLIQESLMGPCRICLLKNLCRTCYALNYEQNDHYGIKTRTSCHVTRIMAYMTSELKYENLKKKYNGSLDDASDEDRKLLAAINNIQSAYMNGTWFQK